MVITGVIRKEKGGWYAGCDALGVFTQGETRAAAVTRLAGVIGVKVGHEVTISDLEGDKVLIEGDLAASVLRHQRFVSGLSLADVQKKLGVKSRNEFARYENGESEPSIGKFRELLAAVAPDMALCIVERKAARK